MRIPKWFPAIALLTVTACGAALGLDRHTVGAATLVDRFSLAAGTAGTVTVGTGKYVTMCSAAGTATNMTMTVTPCGPQVATCTAQTAVPIPSGIPATLLPTGAPNSIADTSTIVFANTLQYWCNLWQYNP
jgi:hypothetical protein